MAFRRIRLTGLTRLIIGSTLLCSAVFAQTAVGEVTSGKPGGVYVASDSISLSNATQLVLGPIYQRDISTVVLVSSAVECGLRCAGTKGCTSFNLEEPFNSASAAGGIAGSNLTCSMINGTPWRVEEFGSPPDGYTGSFFIEKTWYPRADVNILKKTVVGNASLVPSPDMIWPTDCGSTTMSNSLLVGLRNFNNIDSLRLEEIKCRQLDTDPRSPVELDDGSSPVLVNKSAAWFPPGKGYEVMRLSCPDGSVITAIYSSKTGFSFPDFVKCRKPKLPWVVMNISSAACRTIYIFRYVATSSPSPMNDPLQNGTVDSVWGSQCGTPWVLEAITSIWVRNGDAGKYDTMVCCRLTRLT